MVLDKPLAYPPPSPSPGPGSRGRSGNCRGPHPRDLQAGPSPGHHTPDTFQHGPSVSSPTKLIATQIQQLPVVYLIKIQSLPLRPRLLHRIGPVPHGPRRMRLACIIFPRGIKCRPISTSHGTLNAHCKKYVKKKMQPGCRKINTPGSDGENRVP